MRLINDGVPGPRKRLRCTGMGPFPRPVTFGVSRFTPCICGDDVSIHYRNITMERVLMKGCGERRCDDP